MQQSKIRLTYGIGTGIALVVHYILLAGLGAIGNSSLGMIAWAIVLTGVFWGIFQYRKAEKGYMPFGDGFRFGMVIAFLAGLVEAVGKFVYTQFINPGVKDQIIEATLLSLEQNPNMTEEMIDTALNWTETMSSPGMISLMGFVGTVALGLIAALIASAIFKNKTPATSNDDYGQGMA